MRTAFSFLESGECSFFFLFVFALSIVHSGGQVCLRLGKDNFPPRFQYLFASGLEFNAIGFTNDRCGGEFAIGIEYRDESACHQIEHTFLHVRQVHGILSRRDDGMVVGYLRIVEHLLRFVQLGTGKWSRPCFIRLDTCQYARAFWIDVIAQEGGIYTRVGGNLLFVKRLDQAQGFIGRITELLVTLHLQGGKVEQSGWRFFPFFLGNGSDDKGGLLDLFEQGHSLCLVGNGLDARIVGFCFLECFCHIKRLSGFFGLFLLFLNVGHQVFFTSFQDGIESSIPIKGRKYPILFGFEVLYLVLTVYYQGQGRGLYSSDGKYLTVLSIFQRIKTGGIHAEQPVANGATQPCFVKGLVFFLLFQALEAFSYRFFCKRGNP